MHGDDGNADRIGGFRGRSGGGVGKQTSMEKYHGQAVSKIKKEKIWEQHTSK
jgi:hypothetical protein